MKLQYRIFFIERMLTHSSFIGTVFRKVVQLGAASNEATSREPTDICGVNA